MRWSVFAVAAFIVLALQFSARDVLTLHSIGGISPDLVACLAAFISMFAPRVTALWACWILGLMMDLGPPPGRNDWHLIGPHALGYAFGGVLVLHVRVMMFRRRALTAGVVTCLFLLASALVEVMLLTVRSWYLADTPMYLGPLGELWMRLKTAIYSGLIGMPFGWLLQTTIPMWNFIGGASRRAW
jgi:cell shape-determining protein MreD